MALQMVKGKMDNVVFYQRQGTLVARAQAATVQQAAATTIRSRNFGIPTKAVRALRSGLLPALHFSKERNMQIRFSGAIAKWLALQSPGSIAP